MKAWKLIFSALFAVLFTFAMILSCGEGGAIDGDDDTTPDDDDDDTADDDDDDTADDDDDDTSDDDDDDDDDSAQSPCISLDGQNDWGLVNEPGAFDLDLFTLEGWFYTNADPDDGSITLISHHERIEIKAQYGHGWIVTLIATGDPLEFRLFFGIFDPTEDLSQIYGTTTVLPQIWYHYAAVYDGSQLRLYLDGVQQGVDTYEGPPSYSDVPLGIGRSAYSDNPDYFFQGMIDEVRISDNARYYFDFEPEFEFAHADSHTIALYHMNEGAGDIIYDSGIYEHNGVLSSADLWSTRSE